MIPDSLRRIESLTRPIQDPTSPTFKSQLAKVALFQMRRSVLDQLTTSPQGRFVFALLYCKAHTPRMAFLNAVTSLPQARWLRFGLWGSIVTATTTKVSHGLTWCSEEMKCLLPIWAEHVSQMLEHKTVTFMKLWKNWREAERSVQCCGKTGIHKGMKPYCPFEKGSFGACNQAEHIKAICCSCWPGCVLTANKRFQGPNWVEPRTPLPFSLRAAVWFCTGVRLMCSRVSKQTERKEKRPPVSEQSVSNRSRCESILNAGMTARWYGTIEPFKNTCVVLVLLGPAGVSCWVPEFSLTATWKSGNVSKFLGLSCNSFFHCPLDPRSAEM